MGGVPDAEHLKSKFTLGLAKDLTPVVVVKWRARLDALAVGAVFMAASVPAHGQTAAPKPRPRNATH